MRACAYLCASRDSTAPQTQRASGARAKENAAAEEGEEDEEEGKGTKKKTMTLRSGQTEWRGRIAA
eukprot:4697256-Pyramimonas_sp.AAC.1